MADLADRQQHEADLTASLTAVMLAEQQRRGQLGTLTESPVFRHSFAAVAQSHLAKVFMLAALALGTEHGFALNPERLHVDSVRWSRAHADALTAEFEAHSRGFLASTVGGNRPLSEDDDDSALDLAFGVGRTRGIAITETTRANSIGERYAAKQYNLQAGIVLTPTWHIEDGNACDVCTALDDQPFAVWQFLFPLGPPAHPHCRCWQTFSPVADLVAAPADGGA